MSASEQEKCPKCGAEACSELGISWKCGSFYRELPSGNLYQTKQCTIAALRAENHELRLQVEGQGLTLMQRDEQNKYLRTENERLREERDELKAALERLARPEITQITTEGRP